ncbi:MAG: hypothetical protein M3S32_10500 [Acidobacteriota bacterium]|nr:hypothetical protein [Acidobacteriota bacterium]
MRDSAPAKGAVFLPWSVFVGLLLVSWNRWIEPFVDSGRELMVPRRVAGGERLYATVHFHHGPLAPWAGAAVETLTGPSFAARTILALMIAAAGLEALRRLAIRWIPGTGGPLAVSLAVAVAFFLRPGGWAFPFSFDTAIAVASLTGALAVSASGSSRRRELATAACLFAALLSRPELGLAGLAGVVTDARRRPRSLVLSAALPLAAAAGVYAAISAGIPNERLVADGWLALLHPPRAFQNVYRSFAGLDAPGLRVTQMALAVIVLALAGCVVVLGAAAARIARRSSDAAEKIAEGAAVLVLAGCAALFQFPPDAFAPALSLFPPLVRVVPPVCAALLAARLWTVLRRREPADPVPGVSDGALFLGALFAARLFLAAGYSGPYNAFFLPLPIVLSVAALLRASERFAPAIGPSLPGLVRAALAVFLAVRVPAVWSSYRGPGWEEIETRAGSIVLPVHEAKTSRLALADLEERLPPRGTLTGFPEAGFFEYALGRSNPLPLEQFWPGHLDAAGEERVIGLLKTRPPDAIVMINALAVGEGLRAFGKDYSPRLAAFIDSEFAPVAIYGPNARDGARIGEPDFFVEIRVRRPAPIADVEVDP